MSGSEPVSAEDLDREQKSRAYKALSASAVSLILVGTVVMKFIEDWTWVDALYFSVVTVTTVGFGDLTPESDAGKLFTVFYIIVGVGIIATYLNARLEHNARRRARSD